MHLRLSYPHEFAKFNQMTSFRSHIQATGIQFLCALWGFTTFFHISIYSSIITSRFCVWWSGLGIPSSSQQSPWRLVRLKPLLISRGWSLIFRRDTHHRAYFTAASPSFLSLSLSHSRALSQSNNAARSRASHTQRAPRLSESVLEKSSLKTLGARARERERWRATASSSSFSLQPRSAKSRDLETNSLFHAFLMSDAQLSEHSAPGKFPSCVYMSSARRHSGHLGKRAPSRVGVAGPVCTLFPQMDFMCYFLHCDRCSWWIMNECLPVRVQ